MTDSYYIYWSLIVKIIKHSLQLHFIDKQKETKDHN